MSLPHWLVLGQRAPCLPRALPGQAGPAEWTPAPTATFIAATVLVNTWHGTLLLIFEASGHFQNGILAGLACRCPSFLFPGASRGAGSWPHSPVHPAYAQSTTMPDRAQSLLGLTRGVSNLIPTVPTRKSRPRAAERILNRRSYPRID